MTDKDMGGMLDESTLRASYEKAKNFEAIEAGDGDEARAAMFDQLED